MKFTNKTAKAIKKRINSSVPKEDTWMYQRDKELYENNHRSYWYKPQ